MSDNANPYTVPKTTAGGIQKPETTTAGESPRELAAPLIVWHVEQICWGADHTAGERCTLLVEARTCAEAARLAGEANGVHEIERIVRLGRIVARNWRADR